MEKLAFLFLAAPKVEHNFSHVEISKCEEAKRIL